MKEVFQKKNAWFKFFNLLNQSCRTSIWNRGIDQNNKDTSVVKWLQFLQKQINIALSNQLLSIYELIDHEKLLEKKNIPTPQFNIVFQNVDITENNIVNALDYSIINFDNKFYSLDETDLTIVIYEQSNSLKIEIVYNSKYYDLEFINKLRSFFGSI